MAELTDGYGWQPTGREPIDLVERMPSDLSDVEEVQARKRMFFAAILPAVNRVNETIRDTRKRLAAIDRCRTAGWTQAGPVRDWLTALAHRYRTEAEPQALLAKIDEIPPAIALAQAAVESGYGTSRGAQDDNALFGQSIFVEETPRPNIMAPTRKPAVRLASFDTVLAATRSYADNLNSHPAYAKFRALRREMSDAGEPLDVMKLAATLKTYSQRKERYVQDVRAVIRKNRLQELSLTDLAGNTEVATRE